MSDDSDNIKAVAQGAVEGMMAPVNGLIANLLGPVTEEIGRDFRHFYVSLRRSRTKRLLERTQQIFESRQIQPQPVPPKLLHVVLVNGSLEDDDSLQDRWASLLVSASQNPQNLMLASAPEILRQLNRWEATLLDRCRLALTMDEICPLPMPEKKSQRDVIHAWEVDLRFKHGFDAPGLA